MTPNYTKIYTDLVKYRNIVDVSERIKGKISNLHTVKDVLDLETELFGKCDLADTVENQKLRSYDEETIKLILSEQKKFNLTNTKLAEIYKLSRNTVAKWRKVYDAVID